MRVKLHFLALGVLGVLTGCTGLNPDRYLLNKQEFMLAQGNPPAYVSGYVDGCSAGRRLGGDKHFAYRKNNTRFEKDALYARGWQEGQINCRNEALEEEQQGINTAGKRRAKAAKENPENTMDESEKKAEAEMREIWEELRK